MSAYERETKKAPTRPKIIYVMGSTRSGSTMLDLALGSHEDVRSVGELQHLRAADGLSGLLCSCDERADDCPFWSELYRRWEKLDGGGLEDYPVLRDAFERHRRLPGLLLRRGASGQKTPGPFRRYAGLTLALFEALHDLSGASVIVDSSKHPVRPLALSLIPGLDLYVVHLVRDCRGFSASAKTPQRKNEKIGVMQDVEEWPVWKSSLLWLFQNLVCELVIRRLPHGSSTRVRYEDFVEAPEKVLGRIGALAGVDLRAVAARISRGDALRAGHLIAGNRLRMQPEVRLSPAAGRWRGRLSKAEERTAWALTGRLLSRYGYRR